MRRTKKVLKISAIVFASLIVLITLSGFLFRGKIVSLVKTQINEHINAQVDFRTVDISFFRNFPKVSIGLDDLEVVGIGYFEKDTLLSARRLDAAVDIMSFIRGNEMSVYNITLEAPRIHAIVNKDGMANWDILKEDETPADSTQEDKPFNLQLEKYAINKGYIFYNDLQSNMSAVITNLDHSGKGDFTSDIFKLITSTKADEVTYIYGGIPFLNRLGTTINADIKVDNRKDEYSFDELEILLNNLKITGNGVIKSLADGYDVDIHFKSTDADFKDLLSLIPAVYEKEFEKVAAKGRANFEGIVKGIYNETSIPGYHVKMEVNDGSFKYSDLPMGIEKIRFKAKVANPDGVTDHLVVDVTDGHFQIDQDPFDIRLLVKKPMSAMYVDGAVKGKLNLSQVGNYVKLEKGTTIAGLLDADVSLKGNVNDLEKQQYQNFYAAGTIGLNRFNYTSGDYPTGIKINSVNTRFTPSKIDISDLNGEYLKTSFNGQGHINNLLNYLFSGKPLSATLAVNADKINLNDWMGTSADTTATDASAPFIVPANLDVALNAKVDKVIYDNVGIDDLAGSLLLKNEEVKLNNIHGKALDGSITINGTYSTRENKAKPAIAMSYAVDKVDIQKTFFAFNTVQKLMPIGRFLSGKLTSALSANGKLGQGMDIDMSTLSGQGNLLLIEGFLSKFAPLDKLASTLHVAALEKISMQDVRTYFEFSNGKMLIKPFKVKIKDIEMEIGGLQGFDESLDYTINMQLPRALMGPQGNQLVNNLVTTVNSKGIPLKVGDMVNLKVDLGGFLKNPTIKVDLKQGGETLAAQMQQQVQEFAQAKIDSAKTAAKDTLASIKKQLSEAAKNELRNQLFGKKDTATLTDSTDPKKNPTRGVKESAKGLLQNILRKPVKDTAGQE